MSNNKNAIDMKTYSFSSLSFSFYAVLGLIGILMTSCGSYQNTSYDNDGIYGNRERRSDNTQQNYQSNSYKDYFGSLQNDNESVEIFTDVDNYKTADGYSQNNQDQGYTSGYSGWGSNSDQIIVNVYGNNWGYNHWNNYWYGNYWGMNSGWGFNSWYGPGFGWGWNNFYGPAYGWGWNNWYGPAYGWNNYYGSGYHGFYPGHAYNPGIRGSRNDIGGSTRNNVGRTNTPGRRSDNLNATPNPTRRTPTFNNTPRRNDVRSNPNAPQTPRIQYNVNPRNQSVPNQSAPRTNNYNTPTRNNTNSTISPSSSGGGGRTSGGGSVGGGSTRSGGGRGGR